MRPSLLALALLVGCSSGGTSHVTPESLTPEQVVATISTGERIELEAYLPESGLCVIEFTADW